MKSETDRAYAAGVIDSDGSIMLGRGNSRGWLTYNPMVTIYTQDPVLVDWFIERWPGHWVRANGSYRVNYATNKALAVVTDVEPYLLTKRAQAQLLLEYATTVGTPGRRLGQEVWAHREEMYLKMKRLNKSMSMAYNNPEES